MLNDRQTIHGSLISVFGTGILILGDPGAGKSELCREAIRRGHKLVADDAVELLRVRDHLIGRAPEITSGLIELKAVGIVDVRQEFGMAAFAERSTVQACVHLFDGREEEVEEVTNFLGVGLKRFVLPSRGASVTDLENFVKTWLNTDRIPDGI